MRVFIVQIEKFYFILLAVVVMLGIRAEYIRESNSIAAMMPTAEKVIIIDPGHGGWDPGKTGAAGENEKIINLQIALKLQSYLEQSGAVVLVTRNTDNALSEKKKEDMKLRKEIANESQGDMFISIHQNAFPSAGPKGAQVFYFRDSEEGKHLAETIQKQLKLVINPDNKREAKANTDYYILKNTKIPAAIVECGFLSNREEEQLLNDDSYQEKVAWAIYLGIIDYFKEEASPKNQPSGRMENASGANQSFF